jgi:hypothetical protein
MRRTLTIAVTALAAALMLVPAAAQARGSHHKASAADRNRDRIPDRWERRYHLSLKVKQTRRDQDHDGLNNLGEFRARTNPRDADTDNDGVEDGDEGNHGLSPKDDDSDNDGVEDGDENAGKVLTFNGTMLTIELVKGGTVSGAVTDGTEIECEHAKSTQTANASREEESGDDENEGEDNDEGDDDQGENEQGNNEGDENDEDDEVACSKADLVTNAIVHEAELKVTAAGPVFEEVELVK